MKLSSLLVLLSCTTLLHGQQHRYLSDLYPEHAIVSQTDTFAWLTPHSQLAKILGIHKLDENNIFYTAFVKHLKVDIYAGPSEVNKRPLILLVHGNTLHFDGHQDDEVDFLSNAFARKGYVVASMTYRLAKPNADFFSESLYLSGQDVRAALSYFRNNAEKYGINPDRIILSGIGDGALATLNAIYYKPYGEEYRRLEDKFGCMDCLDAERHPYFPPFIILGIAAGMTDTSMLKRGKRIPMILFHGAWDKVVNRRYAQPYATQVQQIEATVDRYNESLFAQVMRDWLGIEHRLAFNVPPIYGSIHIKERLDALGTKNEYHEISKKGHRLILSRDGHRMNSATEIVSKSANFIWSSLRDSAKINGPDTVFTRVETYRTSPAAHCVWRVEGGKIIDSTKTEITIKWDVWAPDYAINLSTWDEMGIYNFPAHKNIEFVKTKVHRYKIEFLLTSVIILLVLFVFLFIRRKK